VARTLLDLAEVLSLHALDRAVHESLALRLFDGKAIDDVLDRANGRRGAAKLREVLARSGPPRGSHTYEGIEERFLAFCHTYRLPRPETNVRVQTLRGSLEVDSTSGGNSSRTSANG